jgi:hypothetical protein
MAFIHISLLKEVRAQQTYVRPVRSGLCVAMLLISAIAFCLSVSVVDLNNEATENPPQI